MAEDDPHGPNRSRLQPFVALPRTARRRRARIKATLRHGLTNASIQSCNTQLRLLHRNVFSFSPAHPGPPHRPAGQPAASVRPQVRCPPDPRSRLPGYRAARNARLSAPKRCDEKCCCVNTRRGRACVPVASSGERQFAQRFASIGRMRPRIARCSRPGRIAKTLPYRRPWTIR